MSGIKWRKAGVYVLVALPVVGLGGIAVIAQQQDSSQQQGVDAVADAARKAREQKKEAPKPKKVYTNEDLGSGSSAATGAAPQAAAPAGETKETPEGQPNAGNPGVEKPAADKTAPANKNDEETWRRRFKEAREKLATAEKELDILQREAQKAQVQYYSDPQKALAEQYSRKDVNDKDTQIAAKKQEVAQLKQHISDMEDELRKSGGDVGWARE
jgi:chromosome segregation ATPase